MGRKMGVPNLGHNLPPAVESNISARLGAPLSCVDVARMAGVSKTTVKNYEMGRKIEPASLRAITQVYETIKARPKRQKYRRGLPTPAKGFEGDINAEWLRRQTENFLHKNASVIIRMNKKDGLILSPESIFEYGKILLLAAGKEI